MAKWQTAVKASAVLKNIRSKISTKIEAKKKPKKKSSITWGAIFRRINEIEAGAPRELDLCAPRESLCPSARYCGRYNIFGKK